MWILTNFGAFMPALADPDFAIDYPDGDLTIQVRSRRAADLNQLRKRYMSTTLGPNVSTKGKSDYQWRALCKRSDWAQAMALLALDIDYVSFKHTVKDRALHDAMMDVWWALLRAFPAGSRYGVGLRPSVPKRLPGTPARRGRKATEVEVPKDTDSPWSPHEYPSSWHR